MANNNHPVAVENLCDGRARVSVQSPFLCSGAEIPASHKGMEQTALLHASVSPPLRKIENARWFLNELKRCIHNEGCALMFFESCVSALRSATLTLQKVFKHRAGFEEWYSRQQETMKADGELRWAVELRNAAEKEGLLLAEYGPRTIVRFRCDGSVTAEADAPSLEVAGLPVSDTIPFLESSLEKIAKIINEAHHLFPYDRPRPIPIHVQLLQENDDGTWGGVPPDGRDQITPCAQGS
jgi:hypothetical protein